MNEEEAAEIAQKGHHMETWLMHVLGYQEDGEWIALALEMDLRGYGETFEEALGEVVELVEMQVSFAAFKGQPEMLWKPAGLTSPLSPLK